MKDGVRQDDTPVHVALREALANVIVHADYSDRASVLVVKRPDMFGFRNPGLMRVPIEVAMHGGEPDCRNRNLHQMFRYINIGEQAGSGIPKILAGWKSQHWQTPLLREERVPYDQSLLELRMLDLFPKELIEHLTIQFKEKFTGLNEQERLITVLIYSDYYLNHRQICHMTSAHAREVTLALVKLVNLGIIKATGTHKDKVYHAPEVEIPTPDNELGIEMEKHLFVSKPLIPPNKEINYSIDDNHPELSPELILKLEQGMSVEDLVASGDDESKQWSLL